MSNYNPKRNLTTTLTLKEHEMLNSIVEDFQKKNIATVSKSDVIRHLVKEYTQLTKLMENDEELVELERYIRQLVIKQN